MLFSVCINISKQPIVHVVHLSITRKCENPLSGKAPSASTGQTGTKYLESFLCCTCERASSERSCLKLHVYGSTPKTKDFSPLPQFPAVIFGVSSVIQVTQVYLRRKIPALLSYEQALERGYEDPIGGRAHYYKEGIDKI